MPPSPTPDDEKPTPTTRTRPTDLTTYTPFTPPPDCSQPILTLYSWPNRNSGDLTAAKTTASTTRSCYPPAFSKHPLVIGGIEQFFDSLIYSNEATTPCPTHYAFVPQPTGFENSLLTAQWENEDDRKAYSISSQLYHICCPASSTEIITITTGPEPTDVSTILTTKSWEINYTYGHCRQINWGGAGHHPTTTHAVAFFRLFPDPEKTQYIVQRNETDEDGNPIVHTNVVIDPSGNYSAHLLPGEKILWPPMGLKLDTTEKRWYKDTDYQFVLVFGPLFILSAIVVLLVFLFKKDTKDDGKVTKRGPARKKIREWLDRRQLWKQQRGDEKRKKRRRGNGEPEEGDVQELFENPSHKAAPGPKPTDTEAFRGHGYTARYTEGSYIDRGQAAWEHTDRGPRW